MLKKVIINPNALKVVYSEIQKFGEIETGGVLMGRMLNESIVIESASDAGPNAIHEHIYFKADPNYIDLFIDMTFANSEGNSQYLGEWHTHPEKFPSPSDVDLKSIHEISENSEQFVLMIIFGAIDFSTDNILKQSYAVLKHKNDNDFYRLPVYTI